MSGEKGTLFTCITCRVGFRDADIQRDHYKSDWHRYNLKRKVIDLEPVTAENFAERVALQQAKQDSESTKEVSRYCATCRKNYGNDKAYANHLSSKKHVQLSNNSENSNGAGNILGNAVSGKPEPQKTKPTVVEVDLGLQQSGKPMEVTQAEDEDEEEWDEIEGTPLTTTQCLFCEHESNTVGLNLEHMSREHSFFVPDLDYCVDVEGLLEYLGAKVGEGLMCLWCNGKGKGFYDVNSVQQHMRDKGHCKVLHEGDSVFEFTDFYDYSSSYPDPEGADVNPDEAYQLEELRFNDNMQLVLPSGVTLGHRALKIYYKQYIRPGSQITVHRSSKESIISKYRAIGYGSTTSLAEAQKKYRDQKVFKHARDKYYMKLGVTGNKTTQHHFRRQVQF